MMKILYALAVVATLISCLSLKAFCGVPSRSSRYPTHIVDEELARVASRPNRWGYYVWRYPSLSQNGLTFWIQPYLEFRSFRNTSVEEVEQLYVDIYRDFLRSVNSIRILRPYLASFPLTPDTCSLIINFHDEEGEALRPPYIAAASMDDGILEFSKFQGLVGNNMTAFKTFWKQSAREIQGLKEFYTPLCPRGAVNPKPQLPQYVPLPGQYVPPVAKAQDELIERFCKQNNLAITIWGVVGKHYFDHRPFEFALRSSQNISLEQAKALAARCNKEMLSFAQTSQLYKDYIKERSTWKNEQHPSPTPIPEQFAYRISFWDENIDRPVAPYIAEIRLLDGKLSYFTADDNQQLVLVFEESFADSLANRPTVSATESENPK
jgi:hypothetical protein